MRAAPERIVSLLASGTELVCALGLGDKLVGRSHECDSPAWVLRLPVVSRPTFDITGSSREIDELVRTRLRAGEPLYALDEALLIELAPDVLITQTHCEVCAVSPADVSHRVARSIAREEIVALATGTLDGILEGFLSVAKVLGVASEGVALVSRLREQIERVATQTAGRPHPSVVCLEWLEPVFAMGNWGPELVEIAGGKNLLGTPGAHSATTPWDAVRDADPDVLVVAPCGFGIERTLAEVSVLAAQPGWSRMRAVREGRVFVADGNLHFNRSGPGLFGTPEILAEILHPEVFAPDHRGAAWVRYP